jgi:hypothetical protein
MEDNKHIISIKIVSGKSDEEIREFIDGMFEAAEDLNLIKSYSVFTVTNINTNG